ncbi:MAG: hypothetical protein FJ125_09035 [Deltaproteobacteria bacterium]|nr:hypothetical protein [Deltaproteobacteria bacterium]
MATQGDLHDIADEQGSIRAGVTTDLEATRRRYEREGYGGTLYAAPTRNMMRAEDQMLGEHGFRHNQQTTSNAPEDPGFVYVIQGKKFKS